MIKEDRTTSDRITTPAYGPNEPLMSPRLNNKTNINQKYDTNDTFVFFSKNKDGEIRFIVFETYARKGLPHLKFVTF
jgi:hypothetical protein